MIWRKLLQKVHRFFEGLEETTTTVESKYLNRTMLRYSNTHPLCGGEREWCLKKTRNGKKAKTRNGKKKNG